jgi:hypothetical protein
MQFGIDASSLIIFNSRAQPTGAMVNGTSAAVTRHWLPPFNPLTLLFASHGSRRLFAPRSQGGGCYRKEEWTEGVLSSAADVEAMEAVRHDA